MGLTLNVSDADNSLSLGLARSVAHFFRIDLVKAKSIIEQTEDSVSHWKRWAKELEIPRSEQSLMGPAFDIE